MDDKENDDKGGFDEELFHIDNLLGELDGIEGDIDGDGGVRRKAKKPKPKEKQEKQQKQEAADESSEGDYEDDYEEEGGKKEHKKGEKKPCPACQKNAEKFVKDQFCRLADGEQKGECIVEAMALVKQVQSGEITMHDFEEGVKKLGKKYIKDWEDEDDKKEVIPEGAVKSALGED